MCLHIYLFFHCNVKQYSTVNYSGLSLFIFMWIIYLFLFDYTWCLDQKDISGDTYNSTKFLFLITLKFYNDGSDNYFSKPMSLYVWIPFETQSWNLRCGIHCCLDYRFLNTSFFFKKILVSHNHSFFSIKDSKFLIRISIWLKYNHN